MKRFFKILAFFLLPFLGISGLWGSINLILSPSGESLQMPVELLETTPFKNYLIPGIVLLLFNGILPFVVLFMLARNKKFGGLATAFQGIVLISWLSFELAFNSEFWMPVLHIPLYTIGCILLLAGLFLKKSSQISLG